MEGQELRRAGLKVTLPRLKILKILEASQDRHLSAEDIYRALTESGEDIGLATVYRVLTQFERAGLVARRIDGREHRIRVDWSGLQGPYEWLHFYRHFWGARLDALVDYVHQKKADT